MKRTVIHVMLGCMAWINGNTVLAADTVKVHGDVLAAGSHDARINVNVLSGTNTDWGTNAVWGTSGTSGFNEIWVSNCAWGTSTTPAAESDTVALAGEI